MAPVPADLLEFLAQKRDSREYRRGLAVKLALEGWTYETISSILNCTPGFVTQSKQAYEADGVEGLLLKYRGARPFLSQEQRNAVLVWLKEHKYWSLNTLRQHLETTYGVVYGSDQSYYDLFHEAKITYKKAQASNPKRDQGKVVAKKRDTGRD